MNNFPIGIFDSGVGGLSVLNQCKKLLPDENFVYVFDRSHAPYGNKSDDEIKTCVLAVAKKLENLHCKAIVAGCNTASETAMSMLRKKIGVPVIGVYPPIAIAAEKCADGKALVLCTAATARQKNFMFACSRAGKNKIIVSPQRLLASEIEKNFENIERVKPLLYAELERYDNVRSVSLGCTHYYFVKKMIEEFYDGEVPVFSSEKGAAKRLKRVIAAKNMASDGSERSTRFIFT